MDARIAKTSAELKRKYGIPLADGAVAATALALNAVKPLRGKPGGLTPVGFVKYKMVWLGYKT